MTVVQSPGDTCTRNQRIVLLITLPGGQVLLGLVAVVYVFFSSFDVGCYQDCHWGLKSVALNVMALTATAVPLISILLSLRLRRRVGVLVIAGSGAVIIVLVLIVCLCLLALAVNKLFPV
jgi:hypothetical protein